MGRVEAIYIGEKSGTSLASVASVDARRGRGLLGDRHCLPDDPSPSEHRPERELTLIESETFEAIERDLGLSVEPADARRNVLTSGVPLNHLVGIEFTVGEVRVRGLELCEPCGHLRKLTSNEFRRALVHRGGLRAAILSDGTIHVGDPVRIPASEK
ncbi:MAG: MOSC domain-containing protein [Isosphaeraceae bacterium]|nr:MOSC domain-containing protein [Isosphaeraceae bacterium]